MTDKIATINGVDYKFYHSMDGNFRLRTNIDDIKEEFLRKAKDQIRPLVWIESYCKENNIDVIVNEC